MTDEPIFICDPPPGPWRIEAGDDRATPEMLKRMNERLNAACRLGLRYVTLEPIGTGYSIVMRRDPGEWPDAEFCAA